MTHRRPHPPLLTLAVRVAEDPLRTFADRSRARRIDGDVDDAMSECSGTALHGCTRPTAVHGRRTFGDPVIEQARGSLIALHAPVLTAAWAG